MMGRRLETWPLNRVKPYEGNAYAHPADQIEKLVASIREFGFINPLVCTPDGELIAGHGRLAALRVLRKREAPVLVVDDLTPAQVRAYRLADNELAKMGDWDLDRLKIELNALDEVDFELDLLGFDEAELQKIIDNVPDFIGGDKIKPDSTRTTNNLGRMRRNIGKTDDEVTHVALHWGGMQVVLDGDLYREALAYVDAHAPDRRAGVIKLLKAGLANAAPPPDPVGD